jgi:hypothetical protein
MSQLYTAHVLQIDERPVTKRHCYIMAKFVRNVRNDDAGKNLCLVACYAVCCGQCLPTIGSNVMS